MQEMLSAPASSTLRAMSAISVTLGESLTITCLCGARSRTAAVTAAASLGSWPKRTPPSLTLGQETLTSSAATPSSPSRRAASSPNSAGDVAYILTMTGVSRQGSRGSLSRQKASTPSFCRPTALSMPAVVSTMRGQGLPSRG